MGGALGKGIGSLFQCGPNEERALIAAGGGAGLAAALNTPLAGVVLVLEELQGNFASLTLFAAIVTCLTADLVGRLLLGHLPVFHVPVHHVPDLASVAASLSLGLVAGALGALFNKGMIVATRFHRRAGGRAIAAWAVVWGAAIGVTGWFYPEVLGSGQHVAGMILADGLNDGALIAAFFVLRFLLTLGSNGTGAAGGLFIPTLVLGALLGAAWEMVVQEWIPGMGGETAFFAVVGMAALFSGVMRTPLTAVILIIEMTGSYLLILPLMAACFAAVLVADLCRTLPINEALLEDDLRALRARPLGVAGGF
jgi:CIC family chloride channel protein